MGRVWEKLVNILNLIFLKAIPEVNSVVYGKDLVINVFIQNIILKYKICTFDPWCRSIVFNNLHKQERAKTILVTKVPSTAILDCDGSGLSCRQLWRFGYKTIKIVFASYFCRFCRDLHRIPI